MKKVSPSCKISIKHQTHDFKEFDELSLKLSKMEYHVFVVVCIDYCLQLINLYHVNLMVFEYYRMTF